MTKFLTTKAHGFILALATIQHGSHPVRSLSLSTIIPLIYYIPWPKSSIMWSSPLILAINMKHLRENGFKISNKSPYMGKSPLWNNLNPKQMHLNERWWFCRGGSGTGFQLVNSCCCLLGPLVTGHAVREETLGKTVVIQSVCMWVCLCVNQACITSVWVNVRQSV